MLQMVAKKQIFGFSTEEEALDIWYLCQENAKIINSFKSRKVKSEHLSLLVALI